MVQPIEQRNNTELYFLASNGFFSRQILFCSSQQLQSKEEIIESTLLVADALYGIQQGLNTKTKMPTFVSCKSGKNK
jgi:hypothetical protein